MKTRGVKPDTRELARMQYNDRRLYLYGGFSHQAHPHIHMLNLTSAKWDGVNFEDEKADHRCYRLGHTAVINSLKQMVVFGGEMREPISKTCVTTNEVL